MPVIRTATEIAAPAEAVWDALVDLESYPSWNPFTYQVKGALRLGERLAFHVRFPDGSEMQTVHIVAAVRPPALLSWRETNLPGLLWTRRDQIIAPAGPGRVRYINHEYLWGPLGWLVLWLYGAHIRGGLEAVGEALRWRLEAPAGQ